MSGLRELKRNRTHRAISDAAIALFLSRGFAEVTVTDVARAAEVSRRTLFAYFPAKEDLVLHRLADHQDEPARVVRNRAPGTSPLAALRGHFLAALRAGDAVTGISDEPEVGRVYELIINTPALADGLVRYSTRAEAALAEAMAESDDDPLRPPLAAAAIIAVQRALSQANQRAIAAGQRAQTRLPAAIEAAERAFTLLQQGF